MSETTEQATFTGEILTEHGPVEALLAIESGRVNLTTTNDFLGSWTVEHCRISAIEGGQFLIEAEGDSLFFTSSDPKRLAARVEQMWEPTSVTRRPEPPGGGEASKPPPSIIDVRTTSNVAGGSVVGEGKWSISKKVAEAATNVPEPVELPSQPVAPVPAPIPRGHRSRPKRMKRRSRVVRRKRTGRLTSGGWLKAKKGVDDETRQGLTIAAAVITIALLLGGTVWSISLLAGSGGRSARAVEQRAPVPTLPPISVTTVADDGLNVPTTATPRVTLLDSTPRVFATRWNELVLPVDDTLTLPVDLGGLWSVSPTNYITITGVSDPITGLMTSVTMSAIPQSEPAGDRRIIVALGALIGAAEPQLTGPGRRALLEALGLDVYRPRLAGLNDSRTYGDQLYHLFYDLELGTLRFTISHYQPEQIPPPEE
jgi:hypothetical protein